MLFPTRNQSILLVLLSLANNALQAETVVTAHRGNSSAAPENTLASIYAAVGFADLSEMDVRATADGELILMHNATVNKTTNGRGPVSRKTSEDIQSLDAGSWFSSTFTGEPVPTLEQAINTSFSVGIEPLIERKTGTAQMFHNVFTQMELTPSDFRVISFNHRFIQDLNDLNPDYQLGILGSGAITERRLERLADKGADFLSWHHGSVRRQETVELVHTGGMELHVWTVNLASRMEDLIELGVDGITTDYPELLHELINNDANRITPVALAASTAISSGSPVLVPEPENKLCLAIVFLLLIVRIRRKDA